MQLTLQLLMKAGPDAAHLNQLVAKHTYTAESHALGRAEEDKASRQHLMVLLFVCMIWLSICLVCAECPTIV